MEPYRRATEDYPTVSKRLKARLRNYEERPEYLGTVSGTRFIGILEREYPEVYSELKRKIPR